MDKTYSIKEMAEITGINESTVRYFRDKHKEFFPYVGQGRKKRYKPEALEALRYISESSNRSIPHNDIKRGLYTEFTNYIEVEESNSMIVAEEQQPSRAMELLAQNLEKVADQSNRIERLESKIEELEKKLEQQPPKNLLQRLLGK